VGAVHAGWRGTAAAIGAKAVEAMVREFGCKAENIRAAVGPNIAQCCFETDWDVPQAMLERYGQEVRPFIRSLGEKYYVNLKEVNALSLRRVGVESIEISDLCTACRPDRFWSHRKVGAARGSQGAIILCKEERL
jgi:YfiH family protein